MPNRIEGIIARLHGLYPRLIDLSLDRLLALLEKLGNPQHSAAAGDPRGLAPTARAALARLCARWPRPRGSACTSTPHRIWCAGTSGSASPASWYPTPRVEAAMELIEQGDAGDADHRVRRGEHGRWRSICSWLWLADLCVLEVGLGGRGDVTNEIARPAACAITSISLDHREMLGDALQAIAGEKAGIMKHDVPVAIGAQPDTMTPGIPGTRPAQAGAQVWLRDRDWTCGPLERRAFAIRMPQGLLDLPAPSLPGRIPI